VQRHSAAVFRDVAALWLRLDAEPEAESQPVREPVGPPPLPAAVSTT